MAVDGACVGGVGRVGGLGDGAELGEFDVGAGDRFFGDLAATYGSVGDLAAGYRLGLQLAGADAVGGDLEGRVGGAGEGDHQGGDRHRHRR